MGVHLLSALTGTHGHLRILKPARFANHDEPRRLTSPPAEVELCVTLCVTSTPPASTMSLRGMCVLLGAGAASALQVAAPPIEAPWTIGSGSVAPSLVLPKLFVAIKEQNGAEVEKIALAASDPTSDSYGNHLSVDELAALTAPAAADVQKVRGWLAASDW